MPEGSVSLRSRWMRFWSLPISDGRRDTEFPQQRSRDFRLPSIPILGGIAPTSRFCRSLSARTLPSPSVETPCHVSSDASVPQLSL